MINAVEMDIKDLELNTLRVLANARGAVFVRTKQK